MRRISTIPVGSWVSQLVPRLFSTQQVRLPMDNAERLISKAYEWIDQTAHELSWDEGSTKSRKGEAGYCVFGKHCDVCPTEAFGVSSRVFVSTKACRVSYLL